MIASLWRLRALWVERLQRKWGFTSFYLACLISWDSLFLIQPLRYQNTCGFCGFEALPHDCTNCLRSLLDCWKLAQISPSPVKRTCSLTHRHTPSLLPLFLSVIFIMQKHNSAFLPWRVNSRDHGKCLLISVAAKPST